MTLHARHPSQNKLGPERFLMTVFVLATLQSLIYIAVVWVLMVGFDMPDFYHQCAAGFSGVLFALKVRGVRGRHAALCPPDLCSALSPLSALPVRSPGAAPCSSR